MKDSTIMGRKKHAAVQSLFIYAWMLTLSVLAPTDTYYSVYVLCGLAGIWCLCSNCRKMWPKEKYEWVLSIFAALFSLAVVAANYQIFEPLQVLENVFDAACCLIGGYFAAHQILIFLLHSNLSVCVERNWKDSRKIAAAVFLAASGINLCFLFFVRYPGVLTTDSITTVAQAMGSSPYNNTMPFYHTMTVRFFVKLGMLLFGDINAGVALFHCAQIFFMAGCFAYAVSTLYTAGAPAAFLWGIALIYAALPQNIAYSVTLWKDIPFAGAALLMVTALFRMFRRLGRQGWNESAFCLGALGLALWRTNGWFALAVTFIAFAVFARREKKVLILLGVVLTGTWLMLNPLLNLLGVKKTDYTEALAVPFQQIARVVSNERELEETDHQMLSQVFDLEKMAEVYDPLTVDPVKYKSFFYDKEDYLWENWDSYMSLYFRLARQYPEDFVKAWIDETKGYWNGGYFFWIYTKGVEQNQFGLQASYGSGGIARCFDALFRYTEKMEILEPLSSIGLHVWILIASCVISAIQKKKDALLAVPILVLVVGLWLGTPVYAEFRYAYPIMLTTPVIACAMLLPGRKHVPSVLMEVPAEAQQAAAAAR